MDIFAESWLEHNLWYWIKSGNRGSHSLDLAICLLCAFLFFLIPVIIAFFRKHKNIAAISVICSIPFIACFITFFNIENIASTEYATGYAFLVWAIALIWSVAKPLTIEIKSNECKNIKVNTENKETEE